MKRQICVITGLVMSVCLLADNLRQPSKWFSIPAVGITEIEPGYNSIEARFKGTIAYKNKLTFDRLEFDFSAQLFGTQGPAAMFQFNKERRDSSDTDHHLQGMDKHNRGYGIQFNSDGTIALVKTIEFLQIKELLRIDERYDFSCPVHIALTQSKQDSVIELGLEVNRSGKVFRVKETLETGFDNSGFIGLMICSGRTSVTLRDLCFEGLESDTDLGQTPRPLYLVDFFQEDNRRLVHWRYDNWTTDFDSVFVSDVNGIILEQLRYPCDYWIVPDQYKQDRLKLTVSNVDGHHSKPVTIQLKDNHNEYYASAPQERVAVKQGEPSAAFYLKESGRPFSIKGFNFVRLRYGDHSNFEADTPAGPPVYDPYEAETFFKTIKKYGYNTARVFIAGRTLDNPGISGFYDNDGLYRPYMENFIDFIRRAKKYGIYVFPTLCDGELPRNKHYWNIIKDAKKEVVLDDVTTKPHNLIYLTRQGHKAKACYAHDFLSYIKNKDADLMKTLLALQCQNELVIRGRQWPFDMNEGEFQGPDGKAYQMNSDTQRQALFENCLTAYHQVMAESVKSVDPELLIAEGMFVPRIAGKDYDAANYGLRNIVASNDSCPPRVSTILRGPLDFADIHIYYVNNQFDPAESYRRDMQSTGLYSEEMTRHMKTKPFFMGEFGSFKFIEQTFDQAKKNILTTRDLALKDHAQGYMMWTFDTFEQRSLWHAMEDESFLKELSDN